MFSLPDTIDALLISDQTNIRYLTGFAPLADPTDRTSYLVVYPNHWYLLTYSMYEQEAKTITNATPMVTVLTISQLTPLRQHLKEIVETNQVQRLGFEQYSLYWHEYQLLQQTIPTVGLIPTTSLVEDQRSLKTETEISQIKKACQMTDACFTSVTSQITTGMKEKDLAWIIEAYFKTNGGDLAFPPIVAFGDHSAIPHHQPNNTRLKPDDTILLDFGAAWQGYQADLSRTIAVGTPSAEWIKAYLTIKKAKQTAEAYLEKTEKPLGSQADKLARDVIQTAGYPLYPHSLGHGLGLAIHENPRLSIQRNDELQAGMVFTVEPAIYLPGQFGIRLEDTVLKTQAGLQYLTQSAYVY
jgi:Xaa-Pro aminopeptidase